MTWLVPLPVVIPLLGAGLTLVIVRRPAAQRAVSLLALSCTLAVAVTLLVLTTTGGPLVVEVGGWVDGLPRARVEWPHFPRHGLKTVSPLVIGRTLREYEDVLSMDVVEYVDGIACSCQGVTPGQVFELPPCGRRGRKGHERVGVRRPVTRRRLQPLESVVPGHKLWEGLLDYAEEDAVAAVECWDNMERDPAPSTPVPDWGPSLEGWMV
jgi:hypothetical protein